MASWTGGPKHGIYILNFGHRHDYVLQIRNDIQVMTPISSWNINFTRLSFEQQCVIVPDGCQCPIRDFDKVVDIHQYPYDPHICVRDKLLGVPKSRIDKIIDYFQQTTPRYGGHTIYDGMLRVFNSTQDMTFIFDKDYDVEEALYFHRGRELFYGK